MPSKGRPHRRVQAHWLSLTEAAAPPNTVTRFENGADARVDTIGHLQEVLKRAGVRFIPADERGGPGVRLKEPSVRWRDASLVAIGDGERDRNNGFPRRHNLRRLKSSGTRCVPRWEAFSRPPRAW